MDRQQREGRDEDGEIEEKRETDRRIHSMKEGHDIRSNQVGITENGEGKR